MTAQILKTSCETDVATLKLPSHSEHCITVQAGSDMNGSLRCAAEGRGATVISQFVFAGRDHYRNAGALERPVVWLQGDACKDGGMYSTQAIALSGIPLQPVRFNGCEAGVIYEDDHARFFRLHGIQPAGCTASRGDQTRAAFEMMRAVLEENGFAFTDVVRTWIYLDRLLEWYDEFNRVRTGFFKEAGIFEKMVPASTGIGAGNPFGTAIMMDALAVQPKTDRAKIFEVVSPLQNPALDYRSSFSRAVEMDFPTHRTLMISGTASIDPDGNTVYRDDPEGQIRLTLEVIKAIVESRGMDWSDLFRGIAYFKDMAYQELYLRIVSELGIPRFPLAVSHADVCRSDLLFEIEVDAIQAV